MSDSDEVTLHEDAMRRNEDFYVDPRSGYKVFTARRLRRRGVCCGSGCRHCPFAHQHIPLEHRAGLAQVPTWLTPAPASPGPVDVLFWSGGKDSYLAWRALNRENRRSVVLLTTFDATRRRIAHQEINLTDIVRQARHLGLPLIGVPLHPSVPYLDRIAAGLDLLPAVARLVFGDLHLAHIRGWREEAFAPLLARRSSELAFPLWQASYSHLLADLEASGVPCNVSAVDSARVPKLSVGSPFGRAMMTRLPPEVDAFGENGEFHTLARVWDVESRSIP